MDTIKSMQARLVYHAGNPDGPDEDSAMMGKILKLFLSDNIMINITK
jgi:hypothetical protein